MERRKFIKIGGVVLSGAAVLSVGAIEYFEKKKPEAKKLSSRAAPG